MFSGALIAAFSFLVMTSPAPDAHPFTIDDMLSMERISGPVVSPDGKWVAFELRTTDVAANKGRFDLWLASVDGSSVKRVTGSDANDTSPRWTPDGRSLLFLSSRGGSSQVWQLPVDGGEAAQVTKLALDVDAFAIFADGKRLCLALDVYPDAETLARTAERDEENAKSKVKARVYDKLMVRHWDSWEDGKRSHLFAWTIGIGEPFDLMKGMDADCPGKPFGGAEDFAISPDGKSVVFVAKNDGREEAWTTNDDLWAVPTDASAAPRQLMAGNKAHKASPCFSPDGSTLAWLSMMLPGYESDRQRILVMDWASGEARVLTEAWDRSPGDLVWSADGRSLYSTADNLGNKSLFAVDAASGSVRVLVEKGTCGSPGSIAGGRILFAHDTLHSPVELYTVGTDGKGLRAVTAINAEKLARATVGDYEQFTFKGAKGETVHGFLVKPIDFDASRKYPVAFLIHGGPQGSFGDHFHYRWNPQAYAGAGYAAVMIDFHGSTGYGQAFTDSIRGDWGGAPYEDLMQGLDHALKTYTFLDGSRVGALGASYGGYMINWIHGQKPERFKAFVCHDGNLDERMAYFDTEELWFPEWEHGGVPWEKGSGFGKHNPIDHIGNWKVPTLVVHGANDYRVVDTQGLSTFTALQRKGVPSKLLYFPDENHWVLKPQNSQLWHKTVIGWLDQWLKPKG